jgi:broad specificity phosphatase PhoE
MDLPERIRRLARQGVRALDVPRLRPQGEGVVRVQLLLIRHGESQGNREGRLQGRREYPLTERGLLQARALATRLAVTPITALYGSPIRRAMDTAREVGTALGLEVVADARVQEYDFGEELSGLTWREIRDRQPEIVAALATGHAEFPSYPGEEGRTAFRDRVCGALGEIVERHREDNAVAVITHAGPIVVYLMETLGRGYSRPVPFTIGNASITTIEFSRSGDAFFPPAVVTGINDSCHLEGIEPRQKLRLA